MKTIERSSIALKLVDFSEELHKMCRMFCIFANVNDKTTAKMATDKTAYWLDIADYDLDNCNNG